MVDKWHPIISERKTLKQTFLFSIELKVLLKVGWRTFAIIHPLIIEAYRERVASFAGFCFLGKLLNKALSCAGSKMK